MPRRLRRALTAVAVGVVTLASVAPAAAQWSGAGTGGTRARTGQLPTGPTPAVSASVTSVTASWSPVALGTASVGYRLSRVHASTGATQAMTSCTGVLTTTSCTETLVPPGTWRYRVAP